jgi:hypothetical protein
MVKNLAGTSRKPDDLLAFAEALVGIVAEPAARSSVA